MENQENKEKNHKIKWYGDCPDGKKNFLQSYNVYNIQNSFDILNKFVNKGGKIRKAWHHFPDGRQMDLKVILPNINGDLSDTYSAKMQLEKKLNDKQKNSLL